LPEISHQLTKNTAVDKCKDVAKSRGELP
jgi:hypothetical protein